MSRHDFEILERNARRERALYLGEAIATLVIRLDAGIRLLACRTSALLVGRQACR
jgi:hypothetical protein